ncbi:type VI secretion system ATPase TssH [Variovorax sp. J22G73]|uniref:type VI secretion system ATPase TssH n=1 Tax=unclassified Variovorax TaxID=663243 RepID=UPI002574AF9C|nr:MULTISPECIES: type VI secretion system ATPase TssH [unclassified Variovorax]MDM0009321.1 type VI secretion system ATPase TssH [Variovorax sp. J22R203]MDM0101743.1 type VI secretion system ATPase TssH [Variovorax sp. J22G73]
MSEISRTALFGKLNALAYKAIEGATVFCKMRGNPYVELEHWFAQLLQAQDSDLHRVIQHYGLDVSVIAKDMTAALDRLPRGATAISDFSPHIENAIERAWTYATLQFGEAQVRTGYLLVGMLKTQSLRNPLFNLSKQFEKVKVEDLADNFAKVCDASPEAQMRAQDGTGMGSGAPGEDTGAMAPAAMGKGDALKKFAVDLTEKAKKGEMDPVTGRDEEIRQIVDILMRRRQNNPLLTGEAGVGKTAVVEGFAQRLARGDVPPQLKDVKLLTLDIGLLQAGASMKGEFEQRLRQVIDEVQSSPTPIILFIDEIHTLVGAGGAAGTGDAANLLKPALARGNLRTIGATTWAEYKKYIEKDPALTRRFQVVQVPEPDEVKAILMLRGVASVLEKHHRVQLLDEAIEAAVKLSHRYIPARQLPDKAVSLLDTACARVAVSQHATPPEVEDCMRRIEGLTVEQEIIGREEAIGIDVTKRAAQVSTLLAESKVQLDGLNVRWKEEKGLVDRLLELRAKLRAGSKPVDAPGAASDAKADVPPPQPSPSGGGSEDRAALLAELHELQAKIHAVQGESPLILPSVDEQAVASVVADWTGIPVGRMVKNEVEAVLKLADTLNQRVIGQKHGLEMIARRIQTSRARLDNPQKPIGVFMLCGTSGVGKTETALALAEALYGGEQNIITINMSEFQEAHTVSTLKGAPPGYVGYGEGGILTEAVRRRPYSVVLLDEVEKAHPDVHEIFFQVFDKGWMEDGEGRMIDFKNTIILLTTNAGSELVMSMCRDPELLPEPNSLADALKAPLMKVFPPALLGRIVTIPYYPLSPDMMKKIVRLQLGRIKKRVEANHGVPFDYSDAVVDQVVARCQDPESGGRVIDAILTNTVLPTISVEYLQRLASGGEIRRVALDVKDAEFTYAFD